MYATSSMSHQHADRDCVRAFKQGNQQDATRLLPYTRNAAFVRITTSVSHVGYLLAGCLVSLLHLAAYHGWVDVVDDLIAKYKCGANWKDSCGLTPMHYAASRGHVAIVRYFINNQNCDPVAQDNADWTALHYACRNGHLGVTQYLVSELHCDPSFVNSSGSTSLHLACIHGQTHIAQYLLSAATGKINPLAKDIYGNSPIDYAGRNSDLLKLLEPFQQCVRDYPVHMYTKVILTGYSGVGKTTISQLILLASRASSTFNILSALSPGRVCSVECLTAGIIPLHVESKVKEFGNMVIYDFAGQQEYYSSHTAVLDCIMRNSAAIFLCIVDLSKCIENISESLHYWISFIENSCMTVQGSSRMIIIGSHADLLTLQELKKKSSLVKSIGQSRLKQLSYGGFISMDCRLSKTKDARHFFSLLSTSQRYVQASQPNVSFHCLMLYGFLHSKLRKTGCTLQDLTTALTFDNYLCSLSSTELKLALTTLSDKGLIMFIKNQENANSSWVIVEKEALLRKVNGTLFAPNHFKQYHQFASNTGIVSMTTLQELFPQHSLEMLVGYLENMEFCHPIDPSALQDTNLKSTIEGPCSVADYLFFPGLIKENQPDNLPLPRFGWCLGCSTPSQYFTTRFLHVLLLRLAFTFPLASEHLPPSSSLSGLNRKCLVWRNGIFWKSVSGVSTTVEIVDCNRWIIVLVSNKSRESAEICSSVIRIVLNLQQELCRTLSVCECLISPSLLDHYPFDALPDTDLFSMHNVARSMLLHHKVILDRKEGRNEFPVKDALSFEPCYLMQPSSVCQLFKKSLADLPCPASILQEVLKYCWQPEQNPQNYKELREIVNKCSIFTGRNPLVSGWFRLGY